MGKHIANTSVVTSLTGDKPWTLNGEEIRPGELLRTVVFSMHQVMSVQLGEIMKPADAHHGARVLEKLDAPIIELEDADYDWLKKVVETYAPRMFGVNGAIAISIVAGAKDLAAKIGQDSSVENTQEPVEESVSED